MHDFETWTKKNNLEMMSGRLIGLNINPLFIDARIAAITSPDSVNQFTNFLLPKNSQLRSAGINLNRLFNIDTGVQDYFSGIAPVNGIGACF